MTSCCSSIGSMPSSTRWRPVGCSLAALRSTLTRECLHAKAWGEAIDVTKHQPAVEVKGATYTDLMITQAQTVLGSRSVWSMCKRKDRQNTMDTTRLIQQSKFEWWIAPFGKMRVPAIIYASEALIRDMDEKVYEQVTNVATLPGIVKASYAMPDAHWGYGFPIGGVAAFDPDHGGVISAGGVGFDISCAVRTLHTGLTVSDIEPCKERLADALFRKVPAGVGSRGQLRLSDAEMDAMLTGGARWAVKRGYGVPEDLERIEEHGCMEGAQPDEVSDHAKKRQREEMGTLGSGNHYLEVQEVTEVYNARDCGRLWHSPGGYRSQYSLRLTRTRSSNRHRVLEEDGDCCCQSRDRTAGPRTGLCADQVSRGPSLPGGDAGGDQLRSGQSPSHHPSCAPGLC